MKISKVTLFWISTFAFLGIIFPVSAPLLFEPYVEAGIISDSEIGWLSSANLFGLMVGSLSSLYWFRRIRLLPLVQTICIAIIILCGLCTLTIETWLAYPILLFTGILQGIMYSRTFGAFASLDRPSRGYAMYQVNMAIIGILCFFFIPRLTDTLGVHAGFYLLMGLTFLMCLVGVFYRSVSFNESLSKGISLTLFQNKKIMGLLMSVLCFQAADMSIWIYLERIANSNSIATNFVSWVLIFAFLAGIFSAWVVTKLSDKKGLRLPVLVGIVVTLISLLRMISPMSEWQYAFASVCFNLAWVFTFTYLLSLQAHYDNTGKVIALGAVANFFGEALGPLLTGTLLLFFPMSIVPWLGVGLLILSGLFIFPLLAEYDQRQKVATIKA